MIRDIPVVPPDSVIHTFSHLTPSQTNLVLTQDVDNLAHTSFFLRNDEWSHYLLDAWFDPLYRSYNFQKAELHAQRPEMKHQLPLLGCWKEETASLRVDEEDPISYQSLARVGEGARTSQGSSKSS